MALVEYAFPVDKVHGKVGKKHKVGFAHLTSTGKNFTVVYGKRSTSASSTELSNRAKFAAVAAAARERMDDPNHIAMDSLNFSRQSKYKTLWGYVFKQEWDAYQD
ncbi:MAG: hypothetical protein IKY49_02220 [Paludibacteraceae bacterium]|nr:hypothetical protein [Paludibacteraceae bacterium]